MSFVPLATGLVVASALVLNTLAVMLTLEGFSQRTGKGKSGAILLVIGEFLLLGYNLVLYPLLATTQSFSGSVMGALSLLWILVLPLAPFLIGVGANMRRTGVLLRRKRR